MSRAPVRGSPVYMDNKAWRAAILRLESALNIEPDLRLPEWRWGSAYKRLDRLSLALEAYDTVIDQRIGG